MLIRIIAAVLFFLSSQLCANEDCTLRDETSKMKVDLAENFIPKRRDVLVFEKSADQNFGLAV